VRFKQTKPAQEPAAAAAAKSSPEGKEEEGQDVVAVVRRRPPDVRHRWPATHLCRHRWPRRQRLGAVRQVPSGLSFSLTLGSPFQLSSVHLLSPCGLLQIGALLDLPAPRSAPCTAGSERFGVPDLGCRDEMRIQFAAAALGLFRSLL
jgi:hypothetical protein